MNIAPITTPVPPELSVRGAGGAEGAGVTGIEKPAREQLDIAESFSQVLSEARGAEDRASAAAEQFAKGDPGMGIHEVMIAAEKANIAVRYATTLKNKALDAYRELINTQV